MMLSEVNTPYEKKRFITYNTNGNSVVYHTKNMQHVIGSLYKDKETQNQYNESECYLYAYFEDYNIGIRIGAMNRLECRDIDTMHESLTNDYYLDTPEHFISMLDDDVSNKQFIGNVQIELAKYLKPERVEVYTQARLDYRAEQDRKHAEAIKKEQAEDKAYCDERNKETEIEIQKVITSINNGGEIKNTTITIYKDRYDYKEYSIFNYLANRYNLSIPIKLKGWINKSLYSIKIENGRVTSYKYSGNKSTTIGKYMNMLVSAINNNIKDVA